MISDRDTNTLYLTDSLRQKHPSFSAAFELILEECNIPYNYLPRTNDVWAVDYMPIQVRSDRFVQFRYNPDYLQSRKWKATISDVDAICSELGLETVKSDIVLDGGNVVKGRDKVVMSTKVFKENPGRSESKLIEELEEIFEVAKIVFVPQDPYDKVGHADAMVRFLDDDTVLINDYSKEDKAFQVAFRCSLHNAGLKFIECPYRIYDNKNDWDATGTYINYLEMKQAVIVPTYGIAGEEEVLKFFESLFVGRLVRQLRSNEIAKEGGVLNCITWNILK